jgi:ABC-2 type transport system ATP-binding protein
LKEVNQLTDRPAIRLDAVAKRFSLWKRGAQGRWWRRERDTKVALKPLDLEVAAGGVTGIIGPNGSGKSTLIRILGTLLTPDSGSASVFGLDVVSEAAAVRRHINRVSVEASFFKELSCWENMLYAARLYGSADARTRSRVEDLMTRLGLSADILDRPMKQLSRGQQQKVSIARSFMTTPSLLLLDEPTTGLDPRSKREVQELLASLRREREVTVLLCTHDLAEAAALSDRVIMLDQGTALADGTPAELCERYAQPNLEEVFMHLSGKSLEEDEEEEAVT